MKYNINMNITITKTSKETKYIITIHGIEVLNQLRNSRYSKDLLISSKRLEILTIILIIFTAILIATKPLYVSLGWLHSCTSLYPVIIDISAR